MWISNRSNPNQQPALIIRTERKWLPIGIKRKPISRAYVSSQHFVYTYIQ
jgi:hypothetical protein